MPRPKNTPEQHKQNVLSGIYNQAGKLMQVDEDDKKEIYRIKGLLSSAISLARKEGLIVKQNVCAICGATTNIIFHHPAYSSPFLLIELCRSHHRHVHVGNICLLIDIRFGINPGIIKEQ